jgi:hypothetical protein
VVFSVSIYLLYLIRVGESIVISYEKHENRKK